MRFLKRVGNLKGELFSATFTFGVSSTIKLGSSLILTRLLDPEAYGIFGILFSFLFMIELLSDVGTTALLIRHPHGNEARVVHTVWTVRLIRCCINFGIVFLGAPLIAEIYHSPILTNAFRVLSFWFLIVGVESMSFNLAIRDKKARISNYAELASNVVMTIFVIGMARILRNHYALIYGSLLQRALLTVSSYFFYRHVGVGIKFDRELLRDQFKFARVVIPSSVLTIILSQYDKVVLLKFFDLRLLGIYGLAGNMIGPITGVVIHNARVVLYARCSDYFRENRETAAARYYSENKRLFLIGVGLPAITAGFSQALVTILYDPRYQLVGLILMVLGLAAIVGAFQNASENLLVAAGKTHAVLVANIIRLFTIIPATFVGYYLYGFVGFLWFAAAATLPVLGYFFISQKMLGLLDLHSEARLFAVAIALFAVSFAAGHLLLLILPSNWLHLGMSHH